jgi:hypothetical protein
MSKKIISGTISGGYTLTSAYAELSIRKSGVIDGAAGGVAVESRYGASIVNRGTLAGGNGVYGYISGTAGGAGALLAGGGVMSNSGAITGGVGGAAYLFGGAGGIGVSLTGGGIVDNVRSISGGKGGTGKLDGGKGGVGVSLTGDGGVDNSGSINGGAGGHGYNEYGGNGGVGLLADGGTVTNSGDINGGNAGSGSFRYSGLNGGAGVWLTAFGTIDNSGVIGGGAGGTGYSRGAGGFGVLLAGGGAVDNRGMIIGGGGGAYGGAGVSADGTATVTNFGTIAEFDNGRFSAAVALGEGLFINEAGALAQGYSGFSGTATVINYGTINGLNYTGVETAFSSSSVINHVGGLIDGEKWGVLSEAGTVNNFGTIEGRVGSVSLGGGARLISEAGAIFIGQAQGGGGTLELASGTETITGLGATGTISGDVAMTFSGFGTYQLDAGGRFTLRGTNMLASGETLSIEGRMTNAGSLTIDGSVNGAGTLALTSGVLNIGTSLTFEGAFIESARATVTVTAGDTLTLIAPTVLDGTVNGSMSVGDATVEGLTIGGMGTLTASGTVSQSGTVTIGATNSEMAILSVLRGGAWDLGSGSIAGGAGSGTLRVYGQLDKNAGTGVSTVGVRTFDDGTVLVVAGTLDFTSNLLGSGMLEIDGGGTLEADAAAVSTLTATFDGPDATLAMKLPNAFRATIAGVAAGDTIDLLAIDATGASVNDNDQLVVVDGATTVATLQLSGAYKGATFTATSDGAGGTDIELVSPRGAGLPSIPRMVHAMATMGAPAGVPNRGHDLISVRTLDLARPHIQMQ